MYKRKIIKKWKSGRGYRYLLLCNNCGNDFERRGSQLKTDKCFYCSPKCSNTDRQKIQKDNEAKTKRKNKIGCLFSDNARKNMSKGARRRFQNSDERRKNSERCKEQFANGRIHPQGMLGKTAWNKDKENPNWQGKNNPNWNNGSSFGEYSVEFNNRLKRKIRKRDNYICQKCCKTTKKNSKALDVHHIDYNKKNCNLNNLITLCHICHMKTNFKRKNWVNYFKRKMR